MKLFIAVIVGTNRPVRLSIHAARLVVNIGKEFKDVSVRLVDPGKYQLHPDGNDQEYKIPAYTELVKKADGFFIVTPEYNHSFPGSLKSLLDKELGHYVHKPVAFAGVSSGGFGGVRAIEALVNTVREMGLVATFTDVHFAHVQDLFDDEGNIIEDEIPDRIRATYRELIWMARVLKHGRKHVAKLK